MNLQLVFPADKSGIMFIVKGQPAPLPLEYNHAVSRTAYKILAYSCVINNLLPINRRDVWQVGTSNLGHKKDVFETTPFVGRSCEITPITIEK